MKYEANNIYNEDCYKAIKEIPDKSIDCIYVDIPYLYGGGYHKCNNKYAGVKQSTADDIAEISNGIDFKILDEFVRIMKKINIFVWCSLEQVQEIINFFTSKGAKFNILVWAKTNPPPLTNNCWLSDLEYCIYCRESGVRLNDGYDIKSKYYVSGLNVLDKDKFWHPTIKPLSLVERHLLHATQPNDLVLDCFLGSGTTAVACKNTGRRYLGFEINKKYFKIAQDRLNNIDANGQIGMFTN